MKLLHISNYLPHTHNIWGGAEVACNAIIEGLQESGISCAVATTPPQNIVKLSFPLFPVESISERYYSPYFFFLRHYWLQKDTIIKRGIIDVLNIYKPDIVHFHNFSIFTFSALDAVKKLGYPAIFSVYDYWSFCPTDMLLDSNIHLCQDGHGFHCLKRCLNKRFSKKANYFYNIPIFTRKMYFTEKLALFDRVITLSENSRDIVRAHGPKGLQISVIPLPVAAHIKETTSSSFDKPTIMCAGWVQARKGQDIVIRAMKYVVDEIPNANLMIVGQLSETQFELYLRGLVEKLGIKENVVFTDKLPSDEFRNIFNCSDVIVIAEQWENMSPVFTLESMMSGKAIVSGKIGGIPEYIRDNIDGFLVKYDDPKKYANAIIRLLKDREMAKLFGASASQRAKELCNKEKNMKKLSEVYNEVSNA